MHREVLQKLASVGARPDDTGNIRLYHLTDAQAAAAIVAERRLLPRAPEDVAEAQLRRGGGSVYLSSSPDVAADLGKGMVVVAVDLPTATPAEVIRERWGDPPRVELEVQLRAGEQLDLAFVDCLDRLVDRESLPASAQAALELFETSPVGLQLADHDEKAGRCQRASMRFLSALRETGSDGTLLAWGGDGWWHCAVLIAGSEDVVVDWTASQFESDDARGAVPYPRIETRAQADARWGCSDPRDIDSSAGRWVAELPELLTWSGAREVIPDRDSPEAETNKH